VTHGLFTLALALALMTSCGTTSNQPVVVNVTDAPIQEGRFRTAERQRDVWIAPHAADNETLQHEQVVTFIEKPQVWQIPSTLEPHTVSSPELPLQQGEYDAEVLHRQREMIQDREAQILKTATDLENLKRQSQQTLAGKEQQVRDSEQKLRELQQQLSDALQKLQDIEQAEKLKREQELEKQKKKPWWKF